MRRRGPTGGMTWRTRFAFNLVFKDGCSIPFQIGLHVEGVEITPPPSSVASASGTSDHTSASVVLVGMRGSGKTFVGELAASALDWPCIDADTYFEEVHKQGVREFVHEHGWPAFRTAETAILEELLATKSERHVISLGGGIVETPKSRDLLNGYGKNGPVVHIMRQIEEVVQYLGVEASRPAYGEPIMDVFKRREPWFKECCTHQFMNDVGPVSGENDLLVATKRTSDEIARFFGHITGAKTNLCQNLQLGKCSYFLCLTYPDVTPALAQIEELTLGVDALELRVDLLRSPKDPHATIPSESYVADQIAVLRRATNLPIIFTVRTVSQGGSFPDNAEKEASGLLDLALRVGVEYIDLEMSLPVEIIHAVVSKKGTSQIVASWHDWSGNMKWDGQVVKQKYELAKKYGDIIKIVGKADTLQDNFVLYDFVQRMNSEPHAKPFLAINMGLLGQMSRILNSVLTPVSHPLLPVKAAPGQLSFVQIQHALHLIGQMPTRRFFLFGTPISHSMSPTLHNTGFNLLGLPHIYNLLETPTVGEEIRATITAPDFGGASVTIPHKLAIIPLLDKLSPAAGLIGAVNTIVPIYSSPDAKTPILYGDNTDWIGVRGCISSRIPTGGIHSALVIGAGGTARAAIFALRDLGAKHIYVYNRTQEKAEQLAHIFDMEVLEKLGEWPEGRVAPNVIVSTVPATETTTTSSDDSRYLHLTDNLFDYRDGPAVVIDMAYKPRDTPLLLLAKATAKNWVAVPGVDALLEQGYGQFEMWTGRRCPKAAVSAKVWEQYQRS